MANRQWLLHQTILSSGIRHTRSQPFTIRADKVEQVSPQWSPDEAYEAVAKTEAILVDIRPDGQRAVGGSIPGALVVERNVLEWRFDPASSARLSVATDHDIQVIVFCSEGYTSSLAAAALQDLGLWRATDIVGGFQAWRTTGLPIVQTSRALYDRTA
jgi:rhodanese-related sulfurtransferase